MTASVSSFKSVSQVVTAIQWRGDNLAEVQAALSPSSPLYDGKAEGAARILTVMVRDHSNERFYPSLGRQVKGAAAKPGDWLVWVGEDDVQVVSEKAFADSYVAIAPERFLVEAVPVAPPALPSGWVVQPPAIESVVALEQPATPTVVEAPALAAFDKELEF